MVLLGSNCCRGWIEPVRNRICLTFFLLFFFGYLNSLIFVSSFIYLFIHYLYTGEGKKKCFAVNPYLVLLGTSTSSEKYLTEVWFSPDWLISGLKNWSRTCVFSRLVLRQNNGEPNTENCVSDTDFVDPKTCLDPGSSFDVYFVGFTALVLQAVLWICTHIMAMKRFYLIRYGSVSSL